MNQYERQREPIGTPAVRSALFEDLYLSVMNIDPASGTLGLLALVNPMVGWIWAATALMALGSLLALVPARPDRAPVSEAPSRARPFNRARAARRARAWWRRSWPCWLMSLGRDPHPIGSPLVGRSAPAFTPAPAGRRRAGVAREPARQAGGAQLLGHLVRALLRGAPGARERGAPPRATRCSFVGVIYEDSEEQVKSFLAKQGASYPSLHRSRRQDRDRLRGLRRAGDVLHRPRGEDRRQVRSGRSTRRPSRRSSRRRGVAP